MLPAHPSLLPPTLWESSLTPSSKFSIAFFTSASYFKVFRILSCSLLVPFLGLHLLFIHGCNNLTFLIYLRILVILFSQSFSDACRFKIFFKKKIFLLLPCSFYLFVYDLPSVLEQHFSILFSLKKSLK